MVESITTVELKQEIDQGTTKILLDVREPWEYKLCQIQGSINLPLSSITGRVGELEQDQDMVLICHHGARSFQAACYLESIGFKGRLFNLEGGIDAWADKIDSNMQKY